MYTPQEIKTETNIEPINIVPGSEKVQNPPVDEGVPSSTTPEDDRAFEMLFGTKVDGTPLEKFEMDSTGGVKVNMTDPVKPSDNPLDKPVDNIDKPVETPVSTPVEPTPIFYTQEQVSAIVEEQVNSRLQVEMNRLNSLNVVFEEFTKNPYEFMSKQAPHLFEKFDPIVYVKGKLDEEFGVGFVPDNTRVWQIGTTDYNYRLRLDELNKEAANYKEQASTQLTSQQSGSEEQKEQYKVTKAKALGLSSDDFNTKVWSKIESLKEEEAMDYIINAIIYKEKLAEKTANIQQTIDLTKGVPSPATLSGTGKPVEGDKVHDTLVKMFGPK